MSDVTIKLTIGNFSVEVSGPQEYANEKFNELVGQYLSGPKTPASDARPASMPPTASVIVSGKKESPAEFLKKTSVRNQFDQAMLLGYFLERIEGFSSFTSTELGAAAKEARRPFANPSDIVAKLTARGLMMSSGDKEGQRAYAVTATGEEYVTAILAART
jgi:hypothetical protein